MRLTGCWTSCSRAGKRSRLGFGCRRAAAATFPLEALAQLFTPSGQSQPEYRGERQETEAEDKPGTDDAAQRRREQENRVRERLRSQIASGVKDGDTIEIEIEESGPAPFMQVMSPQGGMEEMGMDMQGLFGSMMPKKRRKRTR